MRAILKVCATFLKVIGFTSLVVILAAVWFSPSKAPPSAAHAFKPSEGEEGRTLEIPSADTPYSSPRPICHFRDKQSAGQIEKTLQVCGVVIVFEDSYRKVVYRKVDALTPDLNNDPRYIAVLREAEEEDAHIKAAETASGIDRAEPYEVGRDYNARARRRHGTTASRARRR